MAAAQDVRFEDVDHSMIDLGDMILVMSPDDLEKESCHFSQPVMSEESIKDLAELLDFKESNNPLGNSKSQVELLGRPMCTRSITSVVDCPPEKRVQAQPAVDPARQSEITQLQQLVASLRSNLSASKSSIRSLEQKLFQRDVTIKSLTDDLNAEREISSLLRFELEQNNALATRSREPRTSTSPRASAATPSGDEEMRRCPGCGADIAEMKTNSIADKLKGGVSTFFQTLKREVNNFIDEEDEVTDACRLEGTTPSTIERLQPSTSSVPDRSEKLRLKLSEKRPVVIKNMGGNEVRNDKCPYCSHVFPSHLSKQAISAHLNRHVDVIDTYCNNCQSKFKSM